MFKPRLTLPLLSWSDPDGVKLYTISATGRAVDASRYRDPFERVKRAKGIDAATPAFAVFHDGASMEYLVVGWWRNGNELFTSVSVKEPGGWVEDANRYSFCLWDLEVFWHERNSFIRHLYSGAEDLAAYRRDLFSNAGPGERSAQ